MTITETATGEVYHLNGSYPNQIAETITVARKAFAQRAVERRQKARNAALDSYLITHAHSIWVTVDDSLATGNCKSMTLDFRNRLVTELAAGCEIGAVSAAEVLARRDDNYTRRACRAAALRYYRD